MQTTSCARHGSRVLLTAAAALALAFSVQAQCSGFTASTSLPAAIPDDNPAGLDVSIPVMGLGPGASYGVTTVSIDVGMTHTWVGDLYVTLAAPSGETASLMRRTGELGCGGFGDSTDLGAVYTFGDAETGDWWATSGGFSILTMPAGGYRATDCGGTLVCLDATFYGIDPNGTWTLNASDNAAGDLGSIDSVCLHIGTGLIADTYGSGCGTVVPSIGFTGAPLESKDITVTLSGAPGFASCGLFIGVSNTMWDAFSLPISLASIGFPGCDILAAGHAVVSATADVAGDASFSTEVPAGLAGTTFYWQWLAVDVTEAASVPLLVVTPGLETPFR